MPVPRKSTLALGRAKTTKKRTAKKKTPTSRAKKGEKLLVTCARLCTFPTKNKQHREAAQARKAEAVRQQGRGRMSDCSAVSRSAIALQREHHERWQWICDTMRPARRRSAQKKPGASQ